MKWARWDGCIDWIRSGNEKASGLGVYTVDLGLNGNGLGFIAVCMHASHGIFN